MCCILCGCGLSAPTYGTDKPVSLQFFEDIANMTSLTPTNNSNQLVLKSRPQLVIPSAGARAVLPLPQQQERSVEKTTKLKQYLSEEKASAGIAGSKSIAQLKAKQRQEYLRLRRERVGNTHYRRYLTEPPLSYRQPAKTAPAGR
nr:hypothetical protein [Bartonella raoultii]